MRILEDTVIFLSYSEAWRRRRRGSKLVLHRRNPDIHHQSVADTVNNKGTGQQDMKDDDHRSMDVKTTDLQLV